MRAMYLANYFLSGCIAFSLRRVGSEFASDRLSSSSVFTSSQSYYMVLELASRFFP